MTLTSATYVRQCLINVVRPPSRESSRSQTDLIADMLVDVLAFVSYPDNVAIASLARQLSLALVGLIVLTSVRRVLRGATRVCVLFVLRALLSQTSYLAIGPSRNE